MIILCRLHIINYLYFKTKPTTMEKFIIVICAAILSMYSCKPAGEQAIELVQQTKATENYDNQLLNSKTWQDYANEVAGKEPNNTFRWSAQQTDSVGVYLVAFTDSKGWGTRWEVTLKEKIVKHINSNEYLSRKYGLSRFDSEQPFLIKNITSSKFGVENEKIAQGFWEELANGPKYKRVVVYRFEADVTNNTDKFITSGEINGKLKLIFEEKTIIGASSTISFKASINTSKPWEPGDTKHITIKTKDIDKVYLNYNPPYVIFEIELIASDPIGFAYKRNIWEVNLTEEWKKFNNELTKNPI